MAAVDSLHALDTAKAAGSVVQRCWGGQPYVVRDSLRLAEVVWLREAAHVPQLVQIHRVWLIVRMAM